MGERRAGDKGMKGIKKANMRVRDKNMKEVILH
jgi:hypothetical protein